MLEPQQDGVLLFLVGIANAHLHQEAVDLRLGQREGAFQLDRVLSGEDKEGTRQRVGHAVHGDLPFLHGLQQRALRAGRGAVDLVSQHDLGLHRPSPKLELLTLLVEIGDTRNVRGQEVGGELNAGESAAQAAGNGLSQRRLADTWHVLNKHMPFAEKRHQRQLRYLPLTDDDLANVLQHSRGRISDVHERCSYEYCAHHPPTKSAVQCAVTVYHDSWQVDKKTRGQVPHCLLVSLSTSFL